VDLVTVLPEADYERDRYVSSITVLNGNAVVRDGSDSHRLSFNLHYKEVALGGPAFDVRGPHVPRHASPAQFASGAGDKVADAPRRFVLFAYLEIVFVAVERHAHAGLLK
jgi:hypothetical protein